MWLQIVLQHFGTFAEVVHQKLFKIIKHNFCIYNIFYYFKASYSKFKAKVFSEHIYVKLMLILLQKYATCFKDSCDKYDFYKYNCNIYQVSLLIKHILFTSECVILKYKLYIVDTKTLKKIRVKFLKSKFFLQYPIVFIF